MTSAERRNHFVEGMVKARANFEAQDELKNLIHKLVEENVPFTIDTMHNGKSIQVRIDPAANPNCLDFVIGYGLYGLEMGWLPEDCSEVYVKGYLTADEAMEFITQKVPLPDYSD